MLDVHYPYSPMISRPPFRWPDGNKLAIVVTVNIESWDLTGPTKDTRVYGPGILPDDPLPADIPDWPNYTWREYGPRVGYWRVMEILDTHGVRSSSTLNAQAAEKYPLMIQEALKRGWEFNAHGNMPGTILTNYAYDTEAERQVIQKVVKVFTQIVGKRPLGWNSAALRFTSHTVQILAEEGFLYHCDYLNDDQPYLFEAGGRWMVAIPFSFECNDMAFFRRNLTADEWLAMLTQQFEVLYQEASRSGGGRLMNIGLHPHVIGQPFRAWALDRFLEFTRKRRGVFFPLREEIARWCLDRAHGAGAPETAT